MEFSYHVGSTERAILARAMNRKLTDDEIREWARRQVEREMDRLAVATDPNARVRT